MSFSDYVDVFHGNLEYDLPQPQGVAATWFFLKAQTGNTHPGATLPFGAPSVCPYTGGYPTGYTPYWINYHSRPDRIMDPAALQAVGFSHFHQSGTGAINFYYNYFIITPVAGELLPERFTRFALENEKGSPGFYSCTLGGIPVSIAAGKMACCYRVVFPSSGGSIIIDPELNGLFRGKKSEAPPGKLLSLELGNNHVAARIQYAFPLSAYLRCPKAKSINRLSDGRLAIRFDAGETELSLGFSYNGEERAKVNADCISGFGNTRDKARAEWDRLLGAVEIDADAEQRGVFYSCLYHSLVKPCNISGDSPYWNDESCWIDLATMWDAYKAQLPLIFTLYDKEGASLMNSMIKSARHLGFYPNCFILNPPDTDTDMQARALGWHSVYDAFVRGVPADYAAALDCMEKDINRSINNDFLKNGITTPYLSHTWDLSSACFSAGLLAKALKLSGKADLFFNYSENWSNILDKSTGLMFARGRFYEGNQWNYSFRLLPQTAARVADSRDFFIKNLDSFFGYGAPPVTQNTDPRNLEAMKAGEALSRFEGFNNETDMEAPYAYIFANRHDRTAELCRLGMDAMFAPGRGGICGNDDSGGLSGMYVCNTLGLFPASALPYLFIGSPGIKESSLRLRNNKVFTVRSKNFSSANFYVKKAALNGKALDRAWLWVEELMAGGVLDLEMSSQPEAWDKEPPPAL
ncbi:MAG: glycoside hydrolase family 92 protein [Treponema sp.]|jgi:putative alpha-1,2-mannosidase|nr:glycoside hydrolase family 92 protein [Treponema sp.]